MKKLVFALILAAFALSTFMTEAAPVRAHKGTAVQLVKAKKHKKKKQRRKHRKQKRQAARSQGSQAPVKQPPSSSKPEL